MKEGVNKERLNIWRELTILAVMVMELSWGALWMQILSPPLRDVNAQVILIVFFGILLAAYLLAKVLNRLNLKKNLRRVLVVGFIGLSVWMGLRILLSGSGETQFSDFLRRPVDEVSAEGRLVPPELWISGATLLLIWRGLTLARSWGGRDTVIKSLLWGIGLYAVYGMFSALTHQAGVMWLLNAFISAALLAMVTSRVSTLVRMRGGTASPFDARWVGSILAATFVVTGLAAFISGVLSEQVERFHQLLRLVIYGIITLLVLPIAYLLRLGEPAIEAVRSMVPTPTPMPQLPAGEAGLETAIDPSVINELPTGDAGLGPFFQALVIGVVLLIGLVLILRMVNSWQSRRDISMQDERQSLLEGTSLWDALVNALRNRLIRTSDRFASAAKLRHKERLRAAARIRRIYADFMDLCNELGQPRPEPATPLEFLPVAVEVFPDLDSDLEAITKSYLRVRYGELPESTQEIEMVETAWKRVSEEGELIKKASMVKK